jgi:uncharacterized protein (TIGR03437 family)
VCHKGTLGEIGRLIALAMVSVLASQAQSAPDWRRIGSPSFDILLASPATGPVERVWFSPAGSVLYARTASGRVFETADFTNWSAVSGPVDPPATPEAVSAARLPEPAARIVPAAIHMYAFSNNLWRSGDGGRSWENLTAYKSRSVVGEGLHSLAISPADPDELAVANDYGVWRSLDGGMSWSGLNRSLPNLAVSRILATPAGGVGTRIQIGGLGALELPPGGSVWRPAAGSDVDKEAALQSRYSALVRAPVSAVASSGDTVYVGSEDGRIWVSIDGGQSFRQTPLPDRTSGKVERIFADPVEPRVALAALSGTGPHILRTTNTGTFWDPLDGDLPNTSARGVTAERTSGAVYLATDKGVFYTQADLENPSAGPFAWMNLTANLPGAPATDARLDPAGVQLYIALDGYGVFAAAAPHRARNLRIVNAADLSARPAAPGSLLSVVGALVSAARGGNLDYPVLAVLGGDSQIQVPFEAIGPNVSLAVTTAAGTITRGIAVQPVSPAILVGRDGLPTIYDADSGEPIDLRNAAHSGGRIQIMATGLGRVRPDWPSGLAAPLENPPAVAAPVNVYLDGAPLRVTRAVLAPGYVGFYIVEAELPAITNAGSSELYIGAGAETSNRVQIVLEP